MSYIEHIFQYSSTAVFQFLFSSHKCISSHIIIFLRILCRIQQFNPNFWLLLDQTHVKVSSHAFEDHIRVDGSCLRWRFIIYVLISITRLTSNTYSVSKESSNSVYLLTRLYVCWSVSIRMGGRNQIKICLKFVQVR